MTITISRAIDKFSSRGVLALALFAGVLLPQSARPESLPFDGAWRVALVSLSGPCSGSADTLLLVRGGFVSAAATDVVISGHVAPNGWVSLSLQKDGVHGVASGHLARTTGSGRWSVASYGCAGQWVARR